MKEETQQIAQQPTTSKPSTMSLKKLEKIQNNRYLNQIIYQLFMKGKHNQCMNLIEKCKPDEFKLYMKSLLFKHQYKLQKSLSLLSQCQFINKFNFTYLKGIAKNYYLLGKYKSSLQAAKQAYKLNTSDYEIFYIMAKISVAMKDIQNAIASLGRSIAKEPNQESYVLLAKILLEKGKYEQAVAQLKKALIISPESDEIYYMLGEIQSKLGHGKQSLEYFQSSVQRNPNKYQSLFSIAAIRQSKNQIDEALQTYSDAYKITQNSAAFWNNLAGVMFKKNKEIAAYCCLKKALFLDPFRYDIHVNLGRLLMKNKRYVGAQMHFRSALKIKKDAVTLNLLAECLFHLGDLLNSEKCFEQIFKFSKQPQYKINYICLLFRKGEKQKCKVLVSQINSLELNSETEQKLNQIKRLL